VSKAFIRSINRLHDASSFRVMLRRCTVAVRRRSGNCIMTTGTVVIATKASIVIWMINNKNKLLWLVTVFVNSFMCYYVVCRRRKPHWNSAENCWTTAVPIGRAPNPNFSSSSARPRRRPSSGWPETCPWNAPTIAMTKIKSPIRYDI